MSSKCKTEASEVFCCCFPLDKDWRRPRTSSSIHSTSWPIWPCSVQIQSIRRSIPSSKKPVRNRNKFVCVIRMYTRFARFVVPANQQRIKKYIFKTESNRVYSLSMVCTYYSHFSSMIFGRLLFSVQIFLLTALIPDICWPPCIAQQRIKGSISLEFVSTDFKLCPLTSVSTSIISSSYSAISGDSQSLSSSRIAFGLSFCANNMYFGLSGKYVNGTVQMTTINNWKLKQMCHSSSFPKICGRLKICPTTTPPVTPIEQNTPRTPVDI